MPKSKRFPYILMNRAILPDDALPFLPLQLSRGAEKIEVTALADSGATINVLPYQIGLKLGAVWENQMPLSRLAGNLGNFESKGLIVMAQIADFEPVKLAFAWTETENVPVILGQTNFFSLFDVCFLRQDNEFEIKVRI
jgi:hypothetical protein